MSERQNTWCPGWWLVVVGEQTQETQAIGSMGISILIPKSLENKFILKNRTAQYNVR